MAAKLKLDLLVDDKGSVVVKHFGENAQAAMSVAKAGAVGAGVALAGLAAGVYAVNKVMTEAVGLATVQEKAEAKLGAILKATGNAAGFNADQLKQMASGLQRVTTVGDETIINGMAILATFKNVQKEAFERTTAVALDMSNVMGQDLKSSMVQLGKALNDPAKGLSMLTRVGVTFTDQQKEQIKTLSEAGDLYGAQSVMLKELESEFGGAAKAARETFGGAVEAAKNTLGDTQEELGYLITKNEFFIDLVKEAEGVFKSWGTYIKENREEIIALINEGIQPLIASAKGLIEVGTLVSGGGKKGFWSYFWGESEMEKHRREFAEAKKLLETPLGGGDRNNKSGYLLILEQQKKAEADLVIKSKLAAKEKAEAVRSGLEAEYRFRMKAFSRIDKAEVASALKQYKYKKELNEEEKKDQEKLSKDRADAYRRMYDDLGESSKNYYSDQKYLIDKEKAEYGKLIDDKSLLDQWAYAKYRDLEKKKLLATGDFLDGVKVGYMNLEDYQKTWAEGGLRTFETMAQGAKSAFSDILFDALKGDMKSFEDYWDAFYSSLLRTVTDTVADMAVQWAVSEGVNFLSGMLSFHSGAWEIKDDEVVAKLQKGEMVIPKENADAIRETFGGGGFGATVGGGVAPGIMGAAVEHGLDTFGSMAKGRGVAASLAAATGKISIGQAVDAFAQGVPGLAVASLADTIAKSLGIDPAPGKATSLTTAFSGILGSIVGGPLGLALGRIVGALVSEGLYGENMGGYGGFQGLGIGNPSSYSGMQGTGIGINDQGGFQGLGIGNPGSYGGSNDGAAGGGDAAGMGPGMGWRYGGISHGPESGHRETLHGTEAVVPLPDGRSIPVDLGGGRTVIIQVAPGGTVIASEGDFEDLARRIENKLADIQSGRL